MLHDLLTPREMAKVDRLATAAGAFTGIQLMRNAGAAVAAVVLDRFPQAVDVHILCGPGNNGGDGYIVANILARSGVAVSVWAEGRPKEGSDAALALAECPVEPRSLSGFRPRRGSVVIDALYGAGLSKALSIDAVAAVEAISTLGVPVVSIDLPSGISGESGMAFGPAFRAAATVTFARRKPGHLLLPGREFCGEIVVADIGIGAAVIAAVKPECFENRPGLWLRHFSFPAVDTHKYRRGHVGVFSGGPSSTGAARLAAMAAARAGAGAVTLLSPASALAVNAAHLTSIILRKSDSVKDALVFVTERKADALVFGPGLGPQAKTAEFLLDLLDQRGSQTLRAIVVDADALTAVAIQPGALFMA
ncbi:MAG: NAD(P)H-hydrate epimerase, partial [Pseudaminobacter sp.]|nr:NAD(P)H-hydrate epimerase [Pseudaminobacter sp.]